MAIDLDTTQPFTRAAGNAAGIPDRQLAGAAYRLIFPGVHVASEVPDTLVLRCRAALLVAPAGGVLSHHTAARLWGGVTPDTADIHLSYTRQVSTPPDGIRRHRFTAEFGRARRHGMPLTTPEQTFVHCALEMGLVDTVALGDSLVRQRLTTGPDLAAFAESCPGQGGRAARTAAAFVRTGVDSSPETRLRLLMSLSGLPEPEVAIEIRDECGFVRYRLDLGYAEQRLAVEYDGRWHEDPAQAAYDVERRAILTAMGWHVEVVVADELFADQEGLLIRLWSAARRAGVPTPRHPRQAWRRHFTAKDTVVPMDRASAS